MSHFKKYFLPIISIPALIDGILLYHNPLIGAFATLITTASIYTIYYTNSASLIKEKIIPFFFWLCMGWSTSWHEWRTFNNFYTAIDQKTITLIGTVTDYQHCMHMRNKHRITLKLSHGTHINAQTSISGSLLVYINSQSDEQLYTLGTTLCISNIQIKKPQAEFIYYLIKEGVLGTLFIATKNINVLERSPLWYTPIHQVRNSIFETIQQKLSPEHFALFSALFLGNKGYNKTDTEPIQDHFRMWGIAHIFARSGMHISIIIGILFFILWFIPCTHQMKIFLTTCASIIYTLCSWSSVSFIRSLIMFILGNYGIAHKRYTDPLHLLALTAAIILVLHPLNLFFLDFQLSFALTGALIWICTNLPRES